jgi:hypothetical protein
LALFGFSERLAYQGVKAVAAEPTRKIAVGATRILSVSMVGMLDAGETLIGSPTITCEDLTLANKVINTMALLIDDADGSQVSVPIGKAVQVTVSAAAAGTTYTIEIAVTTSAGQILTTSAQLIGVNTTE